MILKCVARFRCSVKVTQEKVLRDQFLLYVSYLLACV